MNNNLNLITGDWVEVRSKDEILKTLDSSGRMDGLPFMPEMFAYCGKRFRVYKRAHKTCDTVFPIRGRRMAEAVHLETRCSGQAHGGCQAGCLLFWKEAWLRPVAANNSKDGSADLIGAPSQNAKGCTEEDVNRATRTAETASAPDPTYVCQATQLPYATTDLSP